MSGMGRGAAAALPPGELTDAEVAAITARIADLDLRGWIDELTRLLRLSEDRGLSWHDTTDPRWRTIEIGGWPVADLEGRITKVAGRVRHYLPGAPIVQLIGANAEDLKLPQHLLPALLVNISAPDHIVLMHVQRALKLARKQYPQPFDRPGLAKQDAPLDWERLRLSWIDHHIVELAELLARRGRARKWRLGARLGLDRNKTSTAEKKLWAAISHLPLLVAQVRHQEPPNGAEERSGLDVHGREMLTAEAEEWEASDNPLVRAEGTRLRRIAEDG